MRRKKDAAEDHGERRPLSQRVSPAPNANILAPALLVAIPPILFYTILFRNAVNIPILDDYDVVLGDLNRLLQLPTLSAKASSFLANQSGEFKLLLLHALSWLQFYFRGPIDFRLLSAVGNGFVLLLAIVLWKMFLPHRKDLAVRLGFFIPVSWLIFQLQYCETLNFATPGLQHIAVLPFSLGAIYLLSRGKGWAFSSALFFLVLAISSDGNGLLVIPVGLLILALARQYARIAVWLVVAAGCIAAYAYRYNVMQSAADPNHSIFSVILRLRPDYVIAFIGSAAGFPFHFKPASLLLGSLLSIFFVAMAWRGYPRRNPAVSYCVLFLLLTAIGVAGLRSDFGAANLPSRYAIYSALFLSFAWMAIVEEVLQYRQVTLVNDGVFLIAVAAALLFSLSMDLIGSMYIAERRRGLIKAMTEFEHPAIAEAAPSPIPPGVFIHSAEDTEQFRQRARAALLQSIKLDVYRPPSL
jgi:hypothetical protein